MTQRGVLLNAVMLSVALCCMTLPLAAQETADDGTGLSLGETIVDGRAVGDEYVAETFGDWAHRCIVAQDGEDACSLYQLLLDENGNSVAEISIFPLADEGEAIAGGTIITPLETNLQRGIRLQVDGGPERVYPFFFCTGIGCISRVGFTVDDVASFKAGAAATLTISPMRNDPVALGVSLTGFTAGFDGLTPRRLP